MHLPDLIAALMTHMPSAMRWGGAVAKRLQQFNIAVSGKSSGSSQTDALTLADLSVQELLVAALRDSDPLFRQCRIEAEETTGDLACFDESSPYILSLDPIDGTKQYRDRSGNGWAVMLHLRTVDTVHYSLVYAPSFGPTGQWVQAVGNTVMCGPDDPRRPATEVLRSLPAVTGAAPGTTKKIYLIGFQKNDVSNSQRVTQAGLEGVAPDDMPGCIYDLMARGEFVGSLIHTPNVYDYPVSMQIARILGGDSVWVHNGQPVNFKEHWLDDRADMVRLPGIVATSPDRDVLRILCELAKDWNPVRYTD